MCAVCVHAYEHALTLLIVVCINGLCVYMNIHISNVYTYKYTCTHNIYILYICINTCTLYKTKKNKKEK